MARPTPVLPEVGSTMVPPGLSSPDFSAASIIRAAIRSLTLPPGLTYSTLASTSGLRPSATAFSRTSGVLPIRSVTCSTYSTTGSFKVLGDAARLTRAAEPGASRDGQRFDTCAQRRLDERGENRGMVA